MSTNSEKFCEACKLTYMSSKKRHEETQKHIKNAEEEIPEWTCETCKKTVMLSGKEKHEQSDQHQIKIGNYTVIKEYELSSKFDDYEIELVNPKVSKNVRSIIKVTNKNYKINTDDIQPIFEELADQFSKIVKQDKFK